MLTGLKHRIVTFYKTADGSKPISDWLDSLGDERAMAAAMGIKFFEEYPNPILPKKFFEKVKGSEHLWEIKLHYGKEQMRLLAFRDGNKIIAVLGIIKKTMDLKKHDLATAETRRADYFQHHSTPRKQP
jgi:hypothetical protein